MTRDRTTERQITDWLVRDGEYELPDRVLDETVNRAAVTPQVRALPGWRMFLMDRKVISFAAGAAAIAVVVIAGASYFGQPGGSNVGGAPTPSPTPKPTPEASAAPSAPPSFVAPGISGWTAYISPVYGNAISYPSDWSEVNPASHKWQPGEPADDDGLAPQYADEFVGDSIAFYIFQVPAPAGADLESWEGLHAAHRELCDETTMSGCPADYTPAPMCLGVQDCAPAIIALVGDNPFPVALIGDPEKGMVTVIQMGRPDRHEAAARYGGSVALLKSILNQLDVREPQAGETPH